MSAGGETLVVVPYVGEFGWELMNWQGRVRWFMVHGGYERVIICARPDRRALYATACHDGRVAFCPVPRLDLLGRSNDDHRIDEDNRPIPSAELRWMVESVARRACEGAGIDVDDATILAPEYRSALWPTTRDHQLFAELRVRVPIAADVVLVPRERELAPQRNQPVSWWEDLAANLEGHRLSVEFYTSRLDEAIRQLSRARLAVGASTGGLHLASLCRCPHYVWGSGPEARWTRLGITNRQRYETIWNPFGTPCRYDECGWQPGIEHVTDQVRRSLDSIGLEPGSSLPSWSLKPRWRIKRGLARLMGSDPSRRLVPWRVRELVRERIV
ncbi:MAG: hypothetical protein JXQ75_15050 [Phycisphaerae bacterium]|nr:hypothetical protein [Phycisphaerae bacterium]